MKRSGKKIKLGLLCSVVILIIAAGIYSFFQLKTNKESYNINLFTLIPEDVHCILQINTPNLRSNVAELLPQNIINDVAFKAVCHYGMEAVISFHPFENIIYTKLSVNEYSQLTKVLSETIFSIFPPKHENYKGIKLQIYSGNNNIFFCCAYYKGVFLGSYSRKLLHKAIEMYDNPSNLLQNQTFNKYEKTLEKRVAVNIFFRENPESARINLIPFREWIVCDIDDMKDDMVWVNGVILNEQTNNIFSRLIRNNKKTGRLEKEMVPKDINGLIYIPVDSTDLMNIFTDSMLIRSITEKMGICFLNKPDSIDKSSTILFFKLKNNSFLFDRLTRKQKLQIISKEKPVYWEKEKTLCSESFLNQWLKPDSFINLAIYNDYLLLAHKKTDIQQYIIQLEQADSLPVNSMFDILSDFEKENYILFFSKGKTIFPTSFKEKEEVWNNNQFLLLLHRNKGVLYYNAISKPS